MVMTAQNCGSAQKIRKQLVHASRMYTEYGCTGEPLLPQTTRIDRLCKPLTLKRYCEEINFMLKQASPKNNPGII